MKGPLLTLPPRQLRPLIFIYLHRLLYRQHQHSELCTCNKPNNVWAVICNINAIRILLFPHRRNVPIHYCLEDLHPFCQVLSVDEFQGEIILWRQRRKSVKKQMKKHLTYLIRYLDVFVKNNIIQLSLKYWFQLKPMCFSTSWAQL